MDERDGVCEDQADVVEHPGPCAASRSVSHGANTLQLLWLLQQAATKVCSLDQRIRDVEEQLHASLACEAALEAQLSFEENTRGTQTEDLDPDTTEQVELSEEQVSEPGNIAAECEEYPWLRDGIQAQSEPAPMLQQLLALPWKGRWVQHQPWSPRLVLAKAMTSWQSGGAHEGAASDEASLGMHSTLMSPLQLQTNASPSSQVPVEAASELQTSCAASAQKINSPSQKDATANTETACTPRGEYMVSSPAPASSEPHTMASRAETSVELRSISAAPGPIVAPAEAMTPLISPGPSPEFGEVPVKATATPGCSSSTLPSICCPSTQRLPSTSRSPRLAWQAKVRESRSVSPRSGRKMLQRLRNLAMQEPASVARRLASEF